jgi:hypothetical protein
MGDIALAPGRAKVKVISHPRVAFRGDTRMFTKTFVKAKAAGIKSRVDAHHAALDALPEGPEKEAAQASFNNLHLGLNWLARRAADVFDDDVETFSGGTDRPDEEP